LRRALERELANSETPPPSLSEVARRLGYNRVALSKYCPDLSRAITARYRSYFGVDRIEAALAAVLESDEFPPPTLKMVAERLGYSHITILLKRFPAQCQAIVARWRPPMDFARVEELLQETLMSDEVPFPSLLEVARRIGENSEALRKHFPELCQAIVARHRARFDFSNVQALLEAVLENEEPPYPSFKEVAAHLGFIPETLRGRFPWLASKITERYLLYRKKASQERKQRVCREVRAAVYTLHAQGVYPSADRVRFLLSDPNEMRDSSAQEAWHQVLRELGLE
jgi:AraC-like DNA-binding protein